MPYYAFRSTEREAPTTNQARLPSFATLLSDLRPLPVPRVSLGLCVRNGENFLAPAIESMLGQTFGDFEMILSDNASTDATEEICRHYAARDGRILYVRNSIDIGSSRNFNQAFVLSRAPYFKWVAHDDVYEPIFLERCVSVLDSDPGVVLVHAAARFVDAADEEISWPDFQIPHLAESNSSTERFRDVLLYDFTCRPIFGVFRTDALRQTSLFRSSHAPDKIVLVETALLGRFRQIDEPLFINRCHPSQFYNLDRTAKKQHIDPTARQPAPLLSLAWHCLAALRVAPNLTALQKAKCVFYIFWQGARTIHKRFMGLRWMPLLSRKGRASRIAPCP